MSLGFVPFRDWPIRRKVLAVIIAATAVALSLAAAGILIVDSVLFRQSMERDLSALAEIIADTSTGALAFDDSNAASETLAALRARPHLVVACLYRQDGGLLARYARPGSTDACPERRAGLSLLETRAGLSISRPVLLAGRAIGTVTMLYEMSELRDRAVIYGLTVLPVLILSCVLAAVFSSRLRDRVSVPVMRLAETASSVSSSRDYSLRADKMTGDEMGVLVDAFNDMLGRIQSRDEELRQMLRDREEANRELIRLNEDLERFAFVASHDLREPLRMISVYTQLLQRRALVDAGPESAGIVANIIAGARRMRELLDDLRAYAELGATVEDAGTVDLNVALEKALQNLELSIRSSGATIRCDQMPAIQAYEGHLIPLFQNLIGNAIKYRGEAAPEVYVGFRRGKELEFFVRDNGIGIAPEFHESIFVAFKRLHGGEIPGSGLGLAICKRVVERYGGRICVESATGTGSTFRFVLPAELLVAGKAGLYEQTLHSDH